MHMLCSIERVRKNDEKDRENIQKRSLTCEWNDSNHEGVSRWGIMLSAWFDVFIGVCVKKYN